MELVDFNLVVVTGTATKDAQLRRRSSGIAKAEFSIEVTRPFMRASGEPVSDLFLVDVYGPLAERCADVVLQGTRLIVVGTLNKESYMTRHGRREHMTVIKAKHLRVPENQHSELDSISVEDLKRDHWSDNLVLDYIDEIADKLEAEAEAGDAYDDEEEGDTFIDDEEGDDEEE